MKIGVLMNVYNEYNWIKCAIDSVKEWCDEFVIVEGAYQIAIQTGANKRSNDGTLDILDLYRSNKKFTILHENEKDESQQLQKGLEVLKEKKCDWYLLVDGDEVWKKQDLKIISNKIKQADKNGIYQYRVMFYNFINSFDKYYDGVMKRVFKITPNAQCVGQNGLAWPDHGKQVDMMNDNIRQDHIAQLPEFCRCFHYTEIKQKNRWLLKKEYLQIRDGNPMFKKWEVTDEGFKNTTSEKIKKFNGQHPEIVKNTELYKLWENDKELFKKTLFS